MTHALTLGAGLLGGIALAIAGALAFAFAVARPQWLVYPYLAVLIFVPQNEWGTPNPGAADLYSRGTGLLLVPLITLFLWIVAAVALARYKIAPPAAGRPNIAKYFWLFNLLFVGHLIAAVWTGAPLDEAVSTFGLIGIVNVSIFFFILITVFSGEQEVRRLTTFFITCAALRAVYGLVRFFFLGGDPVNPYAVLEGRNVTIAFSNNGDMMVAALAAFICAWRLVREPGAARLPRGAVLLYGALAVLEASAVVLSNRRAAWGGLVLTIFVFLLSVPPSRRRVVAAATACLIPIVAVGVIVGAEKRFSETGSAPESWVEYIAPDFQHTVSPLEEARPRELELAFNTILRHALFGVGTWGRYEGWGIPWQVGENAYAFFHSGFGNVALKGGVLALSLFLGMLIAPIAFSIRVRRAIAPEHRGLFYAGAAGIAYMLPTLALATTTIELRTMQVFALILALPYLAYRATHAPVRVDAHVDRVPAGFARSA